MNPIIIILIIAVIFLLYLLYAYFASASTKLSSEKSLLTSNTPITISASPASTRYALGIWIYVNSWNGANSNKIIYSFPGKIQLYLDKNMPTLKVSISMNPGDPDIIVTENFPIQKWTYVLISVDNTFVDCYLDGKLLKSSKMTGLQNSPTEEAPKIYLGGLPNSYQGNDITVSNFIRWTTPLIPSDVWTIYMKGNGTNILKGMNDYGLDVSLLKNKVTTATYNIF
jgi:hypothetical protein